MIAIATPFSIDDDPRASFRSLDPASTKGDTGTAPAITPPPIVIRSCTWINP
jgi:hypothetical protein